MSWVFWAVVGLALLMSELFVGAFYLVLIASGFFAAAVLAYAEWALPYGPWVAVSAGALAAFLLLGLRSRQRAVRHPAQSNADLNPDIGVVLQVPDARVGVPCRVSHRGALWDALVPRLSTDHRYRIASIQGARLVLEPLSPAPASGSAARTAASSSSSSTSTE